MTPEEFYRKVAEAGQPGAVVTFAPGPMQIKIGAEDIAAAALLLSIQKSWPDLTMSQVLDLLDAARWWVTFWSAQPESTQP